MTSGLDFENSIQSPDLKNVARHWNMARGSRRIPAWQDIKPSCIARQLPIVWAYHYDPATQIFTGRLAGNRFSKLVGIHFKGLPMRDAYPACDYDRMFANCRRVAEEPALHRRCGILFRDDEKFGFGERIVMPLAENGVAIDGILGVTEFGFGEAPSRPATTPNDSLEQWFAL